MNSLNALAEICYKQSAEKGFWDEGPDRNRAEMIALMHSELSEWLEALRDPDEPESQKLDGFSLEEEEAADIIIRVLDYCGGFGLDVGNAVAAKLYYNSLRPEKHGRLF